MNEPSFYTRETGAQATRRKYNPKRLTALKNWIERFENEEALDDLPRSGRKEIQRLNTVFEFYETPSPFQDFA